MNTRLLGSDHSAMREVLVFLFVVFSPSTALAVDEFKAKYVAGTLVGVPTGTKAPLDLEAEALAFRPKGQRIDIPWQAIRDVRYERSGLGAASRALTTYPFWPSIFFTKGAKHLVTLSFDDRQGASQTAVFELRGKDVGTLLSTLRSRTGRAIACTGEDVNRPLEACAVTAAPSPAPGLAQAPGAAPRVAEPMASVARQRGARVRVLAPAVSGSPIEGELVASDDLTITIRSTRDKILDRTYGGTFRLPRESVVRFERSVRPGRKLTAALVGGGISAAVLLSTSTVCEKDEEEGCDAMVLPVFALPGLLLGAVLGPGERWAVEDAKSVAVTVAPTKGGVGVSVALRF